MAPEAAAATHDVPSQVLWRSARAKVAARRGNLEEAEALAREAVRIAEPTDLLNTQGDAFSDLAEVLTVTGRREEALEALQQASARYESKGNRMSLDRAGRAARELAAKPS